MVAFISSVISMICAVVEFTGDSVAMTSAVVKSIEDTVMFTGAVLALNGLLEALTVDGVALIGFVVALRGVAVEVSGVDEFALTDAVVVSRILMCYWYLSKQMINSFFLFSVLRLYILSHQMK